MGQVKRMLEEAEMQNAAEENFSRTLTTFEEELDDEPLYESISEIDEFFGRAQALLQVMQTWVERAQAAAHQKWSE